MKRNLLNLEKIKYLLEEGKSISEIAKIMDRTYGTIYSSIKRNNLKYNIPNRIKLDKNAIIKLANDGLSCAEIARKLNYKVDGVYAFLKRNNIKFFNGRYNRSKTLTNFEKSVIIGTLYGDSALPVPNKNPYLSGGHGIRQKEYCKWKISLIKNVYINSYDYLPQPDKRTGKMYKVFGFKSECNNCFWEFRNKSYNKEGIKIISKELLDKYYNELSLAIHYMDDGCYTNKTTPDKNPRYTIYTMGFDIESIKIFQDFLYQKWKLETTIQSSNSITIRTNSNKKFANLIYKYLHKDMKYKIKCP